MLFSRPSQAVLFLAASLVASSPIQSRQTTTSSSGPGYGLDPSQNFSIIAQSSSNSSKTWALSAAYASEDAFLQGTLQLNAYPEPYNETASYFTLVASHYGTQLSVYSTAPCTSAAYCNQTAAAFPNNPPTAGAPLTFNITNSGPSFGGLAFYGQWEGSDIESSSRNLLTAAGDVSLDTFTVCEGEIYPVLTYGGAASTTDGYPTEPCTPVLLLANPLPTSPADES